ncbi:MAG: cupin domain-containing protein [Chloroflexi bacterium]|nr:cupin domain-containing protein [Chloroflexota bacterium]
MPRQFFTARDIEQLARDQKSKILLISPDDVITQEAEEVAAALGFKLIREVVSIPPSLDRPISNPPVLAQAVRPLKAIRGTDVVVEPFGDAQSKGGANVRLKDVITSADGSPMASGYMTLDKGEFEWTLTYDEIDIVIEGELVITRGGQEVHCGPGDTVFIPKNSKITFGTPSRVRFVYVTYPANWNQ